jgi:outer membrane protein insertion porin family
MRRNSKLTAAIFLLFILFFNPTRTWAQEGNNSSQKSALEAIFESRNPQEYILGQITVTGNKRYDNALVISISGLNPGDKIIIPGGDQFSRAIQNIWKQNLFADIEIFLTKITGNKIDVEIAVTERPGLNNFELRGIKKSEQDELKDKTLLTRGRPITENMKRTAEEAIRKFYKEKAFINLDIVITERPVKGLNNSSDLIFDITKGKKVKVNKVSIYGNENAEELKVKKQLKGTKEMTRITLFPKIDSSAYGVNKMPSSKEFLKNRGYLFPSRIKEFIDPYFRFKLFSSAKFNEEKYREDKEKIIAYYNSLGYRDAFIEKDTMYYGGNGNLNIDIKVNEGRQYRFGDITWKGNTKYSDSVLTFLLGIEKGDIYNLETLEKKLGKQLSPEGGDISGLYMDDGYLFFRIEPIEKRVYNDTIDFEIQLMEGPQATIKNVRITGNDKTKEYVIRRELRTVPGEKFSRADLIRSQREIANLNYFNQENIGISPQPNQDDGTVDINYSVEEKSSDQLELSAGWGGGIGLTGTLGVSFNNFSIKNIFDKKAWDPLPTGDGQKLSLRMQSNGRAFRSYNFSFTEPWLGGKRRNPFTISFFNTKFSNAFDPNTFTFSRARSDSSFLKNTGVTIALGRQLKWPDDFFSLTTALNYTNYRLRNYQALGFAGLNNVTSHNINLKLTLQRYSLDQPTFPRQGSNFMLSVQATPPYSLFNSNIEKSGDPYKLVEYHKWRFNGEWYVPIGKAFGAEKNKQFVLKFAAKYGFMGRYNKNMPLSPFERFQVGDAGLTNNFGVLGYDIIAHRGYPVYESSNPRVNPDQQQANEFFTIFNKYTLELRFPFSTNPSSTIYGLTFFEAANGWFNFKEYNPFQLRRSAGVGMRFFLPMFGLLGFDYGIGFDRFQPGGRLRDAARFTFMLGFEPE